MLPFLYLLFRHRRKTGPRTQKSTDSEVRRAYIKISPCSDLLWVCFSNWQVETLVSPYAETCGGIYVGRLKNSKSDTWYILSDSIHVRFLPPFFGEFT